MKLTLITILSCLTFTFVSGQIVQSIGIHSGLSYTNQVYYFKDSHGSLKKDQRQGFYNGITLDFLKKKYFNITTDLGYCQKGSTENISIQNTTIPEGWGTVRADSRFDYLTFNTLLKIKAPPIPVAPYALAGFRLDYLLSYKTDLKYPPNENDFHKTIFGLTFGAGLEYKIKHIGINMEFHYHYDLTKLTNTPTSPTSPGVTITNKANIIMVGIKYYLHKKEETK